MSTTDIGVYPVVIEPQEEGGYFAYCPLLQGCHAEGKTYGEALDNIRDVIKVHVALRKQHNETVPSVRIKNHSDLNIQIPVPV